MDKKIVLDINLKTIWDSQDIEELASHPNRIEMINTGTRLFREIKLYLQGEMDLECATFNNEQGEFEEISKYHEYDKRDIKDLISREFNPKHNEDFIIEIDTENKSGEIRFYKRKGGFD